jgi:hypothetical protein
MKKVMAGVAVGLALGGAGVGLAACSPGHGSKTTTTAQANKTAAARLAAVTTAMSKAYAREVSSTKALKAQLKAHGNGRAAIHTKILLVLTWLRIEELNNKPTKATDPQLIDAKKSLSPYLDLLVAADAAVAGGFSLKGVNAVFGLQQALLLGHLKSLAAVIAARYPNVADWRFLPARCRLGEPGRPAALLANCLGA